MLASEIACGGKSSFRRFNRIRRVENSPGASEPVGRCVDVV